VTIPSQIRYVHYYGDMLSKGLVYEERVLFLKKVIIHTIPRIAGGTCGTAHVPCAAWVRHARTHPCTHAPTHRCRGPTRTRAQHSTVFRDPEQGPKDLQVQGRHGACDGGCPLGAYGLTCAWGTRART
jgi:hypothetical protein